MIRRTLHTAVLAIGTLALTNAAYAGEKSQTVPGNNMEGVREYVMQSEKTQHKKPHETKSTEKRTDKAAHQNNSYYNQ
tara:strand:- start:10634 stop:10867 length:234 start_codon:yes stop_codon:yes gene_type:complete